MSRAPRWLAGATAAATAVLAVAAVALHAVAASQGARESEPAGAAALLLLATFAPAAVGLFVAWRRPSNRVAWILLAGPLSIALVFAAEGVADLALYHDRGSAVGAWAACVAELWPVLFLWQLALAFVFPDGRLSPARRWRRAARFAAVAGGGLLLALFLAPEHDSAYGLIPSPLPALPKDAALVVIWTLWVGLLVSLILGALALRARYKAADPQARRQILWLAYGALLLPLWLGGGTLVARVTGFSDVIDGLGLVLIQVWPAVAVAIAVTRHGLYAIDRLVNRTLVYAALTALLVATYALVALGAGLVVGGSAASASLATLAAALAFRPLRDRVQRTVDRRFAPARFEAARLLREFLDDVRHGRAEPEDIGAVVALALGDPSAQVFFRLPETGAYADRNGRIADPLPDDGRAREPIGRDDREAGVLLHSPAPGRGPDVLRVVLDAAAVPVELARLRVELRLQLAEVESSRARIAQAGYEERRRIERDLHDGAQQRLVTLGIVLRRLQRSLPKGAQMLNPALDAAVDEVAAAIGDLRTIAAGVRPPRLDEGLSAALADLARGAAVPVDVVATPDRAPPEVEAAAYFVACEALTNAVKHAAPTRVVLETSRADGHLRMVIADDGVGGAATTPGRGLAGMLDRVAAQGGTMEIESPPGAGTRIAVQLPCAS
jgi:signal transduction histidine kinase